MVNGRNKLNHPALLYSVLFIIGTTTGGFTHSKRAAGNHHLYTPTTTSQHAPLSIPSYKPATTRVYDLLHTRLEIKVDWPKQQLHSKAILQIKPHFYPQCELALDAHQLIIHSVKLIQDEVNLNLVYRQSEGGLHITLDQLYTKEDILTIEIDYSTQPQKSKKNGIMTFNHNQGVYFIPARGSHTKEQLWTQGEPNSSSYWFPTLDSPNQRCTQETYITIDNRFKTLSNGTLIYTILNEDQTRTDYWRLDLPHPPYSFMIAIGEFFETQDEWNDIPLSYYVEEAYAPYAATIFKNIPEMLSFFSEQLDYPFPWPSYKQVVVRDYLAGAMENTTAVIFSEAIQGDERALLDKTDREEIIAHELFHHWFGNLVTCESWGQLPLNEAFATWGSHLWYDYKYGRFEQDQLITKSIEKYLAECQNKKVSLIRTHYTTPFDMFDSHTYHKGALILHTLMNYLGKEAFLQAISEYLKNYAFSATDIHQLRKCFEEVSGEDLNWFFNQWFFSPGHPILRIEQSYKNGILLLKIWQKQTNPTPTYHLPLAIDIWLDNNKEQHRITLEKPYQEFTFKLAIQLQAVCLDRNYLLAGEIEHIQSSKAWHYLYQQAKDFFTRYQATQAMQNRKKDGASYYNFFMEVLGDTHWSFQQTALDVFKNYHPLDKSYPSLNTLGKKLIHLLNSPNSLVRKKAIKTLNSLPNAAEHQALYKAYINDSSYQVAATALYAYASHTPTTKPSEATTLLTQFEKSKTIPTLIQLAKYYTTSRQPGKYTWLEKKTKNYCTQMGGEKLITLLAQYTAVAGTSLQQATTLSIIEEILMQHTITPSLYQATYKALQLLPDKKATTKLLTKFQLLTHK